MKSAVLHLILLISLFATSINAQELATDTETEPELTPFEIELQKMNWQSEGTGQLDDIATIEIPEGYNFIQNEDTRRLMQMFGNIPSNIENGLICPKDLSWFVVFEFSEEGYVNDDEKDSLDAYAILEDLKAGSEAGNIRRDRKSVV
jgi:uncharacterized membrane-anchored protein